MIIGNGLLARSFDKYKTSDDVIIFASGVANSLERSPEPFLREKKLLLKTINENPGKTFVYFGTCSVYEVGVKDMPYPLHKLEMEGIVKNNLNNYYIFRLPQVVGDSKNSTLVSYFKESLLNGLTCNIWSNSTRNLIDIDDVFKISEYLISNEIYKNEVTDIAFIHSIKPLEIYLYIAKLLGVDARYELVDKGVPFNIDTSKLEPILQALEYDVTTQCYYKQVIEKYIF